MRTVVCATCQKEFEHKGRGRVRYCEEHRSNRYARFEERHLRPCIDCGRGAGRKAERCRKCSDANKEKQYGEAHPNWKSGRTVDVHGYTLILVPPEQRQGRRYRHEHILVWEAANGPLPKGYIVHHLNHVKVDNRLENLEAMPRGQHARRHGEQRILELEAENARLRAQLNGTLHTKIQT